MSLGLGFFSHFPRFPNFSFSRAASSTAFVAAASALGLGLGVCLSLAAIGDEEEKDSILSNPSSHCQIGWASLSLSHANASSSANASPVEPRTGEVFPQEVNGGRRLLGVGLRKTNVLGLKTIDVYAFGVYADDSRIWKLTQLSDALDTDIPITVRLQIVYSRLSIRSVRNAFAKSVGARLKKFSTSDPSDTDQLLQKFVSLFKDDQKLLKGSVIELSRDQGYVLRTTIDGKQVGQIESKLLCKSILDLYFGEDPLDKSAKEKIELNLASRLKTT